VPTQERIAVVLAVLVAAAAAALWWLVDGREGPAPDVTTAASAEAEVASAEVKETVRDVATEAASRVYGYSWESLGDDRAAARAMLTGRMLDQYDRAMAGVGTTSRRDHTVVTATVVDTALVHATTSYARVLVFVNRSTDSDELESPTLDLDRVLVSLRRVDGDWKVSELDAL
jgi:Mce-associated membrane protein